MVRKGWGGTLDRHVKQRSDDSESRIPRVSSRKAWLLFQAKTTVIRKWGGCSFSNHPPVLLISMLGIRCVNCFALNCVAQVDDALIGLKSLVLNSGMDLARLRD